MKALSHAQLAAAQERQDWALLWQHVLPVVQLVVGRMARNSAIRAESVEDLEQEGSLIAGEAVRTWRPLECALATYVGNQVRWGLVEAAARERNHGIGSHEQQPAVLSVGDARDEGGTPKEASQDDEDAGDDGSFDTALTYAGVLRRYTGQYDGEGYVPEGLGDPSDEADRALAESAVRRAAVSLRDPDERDALIALLSGEKAETYAVRRGVTSRTVRNWLGSARRKLSATLPQIETQITREEGNL